MINAKATRIFYKGGYQALVDFGNEINLGKKRKVRAWNHIKTAIQLRTKKIWSNKELIEFKGFR